MVRSTQGTPLCVLYYCTALCTFALWGIWQCMVYGVASMVLPATAPTGTSPPTSHRQTSRAAYCVLRGVHGVRGAWHRVTVAPGTSMQYTVSLFLRRMSPFYTLHVVLQLWAIPIKCKVSMWDAPGAAPLCPRDRN